MARDEQKQDGWLIALYTLLILCGLVLLAIGALEAAQNRSPLLLGIAVLAVIVSVGLYPIVSSLRDRNSDQDLLQQQIELMRSINDRLLISDAAKRTAYREQDRNAVRQAIREDMARADYDAALVLVRVMAEDYGYLEEAEKFREEILETRRAELDAKMNQATEKLDAIIARREWDTAAVEAAKIQRLFPEAPQVSELADRVRDARGRYKKELEIRFLQAAERNEVDLAMELLKELDQYLSNAEAEHLREIARGVVTKKRDNLGVQFKMAVHDREWLLAVRIGEQIIREFPNTRMAEEVRGMIEVLRARSAEQRRTSSMPATEA